MSKSKVIEPMKKDGFVEEKGTLKTDLKRGVEIGGKTQNLMVTIAENHKKGAFSISFKWNMDGITGDDVDDSATLQAVNQMLFTARDKCLAWRKEWKNDNPTDPEQLGMGFEDS